MKQYKIVKEFSLKTKSSERVHNYKMSSPQNVFEFLKDKIGDEAQENVVSLYLNNKNELSSWSLTSRGTVTESIVHPREVFKYAVMSNSSGIILAHNHPSGVTNPSKDDIATTERIQKAGDILGIPLLDHVIISKNNYASLKEQGYIT